MGSQHKPATNKSSKKLPPLSSASSSSSSSSSSPSSADAGSSLSSSAPLARTAMDGPSVELLRCSRCAKAVEIISRNRGRLSADDIVACGMVRFGHNLYYCDRCAVMVGYK